MHPDAGAEQPDAPGDRRPNPVTQPVKAWYAPAFSLVMVCVLAACSSGTSGPSDASTSASATVTPTTAGSFVVTSTDLASGHWPSAETCDGGDRDLRPLTGRRGAVFLPAGWKAMPTQGDLAGALLSRSGQRVRHRIGDRSAAPARGSMLVIGHRRTTRELPLVRDVVEHDRR